MSYELEVVRLVRIVLVVVDLTLAGDIKRINLPNKLIDSLVFLTVLTG